MPYSRRRAGRKAALSFLISKMKGGRDKLSQEQVPQVTAVRRGDSGDRGPSGCNNTTEDIDLVLHCTEL